MKKLFLFVAFYTVVAFGGTPPGGLAFTVNKENHDDQRCCADLLKMAAYDAAAFACHGLGLYIIHSDVVKSDMYKRAFNSDCDMRFKTQVACAYICLQSTVQCCLYCITRPLCCSQSAKYYKACCHATNLIGEQNVKQKRNASKMDRD